MIRLNPYMHRQDVILHRDALTMQCRASDQTWPDTLRERERSWLMADLSRKNKVLLPATFLEVATGPRSPHHAGLATSPPMGMPQWPTHWHLSPLQMGTGPNRHLKWRQVSCRFKWWQSASFAIFINVFYFCNFSLKYYYLKISIFWSLRGSSRMEKLLDLNLYIMSYF